MSTIRSYFEDIIISLLSILLIPLLFILRIILVRYGLLYYIQLFIGGICVLSITGISIFAIFLIIITEAKAMFLAIITEAKEDGLTNRDLIKKFLNAIPVALFITLIFLVVIPRIVICGFIVIPQIVMWCGFI